MKAKIVKSKLVREILDNTSPEKKKEIQDRIDLQGIYVTLLNESKDLEPEIVDMVNRNFEKLLLKI